MITQRLIVFILLIIHIHTHPIEQTVEQKDVNQRRNVDLIQWESVLKLLNQLYHEKIDQEKISGSLSDYRPFAGPVNIEQLPAILASRHVQRYPYSQQNDPSIIGR